MEVSGDYREELVGLEWVDLEGSNGSKFGCDGSDSGNDTDDLIEDAKTFVRIGQR